MLLSNVLAVLNFTDVCGQRGGVHIGNSVIVASAFAVVVTYDLTNNILIFSVGIDAVVAVNEAICKGIADNIAGIIATCADVTNQTAKLISALNGNIVQTAVGNIGITVADNTTGVLTACNGGVGDGDVKGEEEIVDYYTNEIIKVLKHNGEYKNALINSKYLPK